MPLFDKVIETLIKEAQARGEFDNLPGKGKPDDLTDYFNAPEDVRVAQVMLRSAGMVPVEIELLQEIAALKELFASKTQKEWIAIFEKVDTCLTPVLTPDETLKNPHLQERDVITTMDDPARGENVQIGFPARFSDELDYKRSPAPLFGEHTREVLASLGYTSDEIEKLQDRGVI